MNDAPLSLDLRALALSRAGLGVIMFADLIGRLGDLDAHYTDAGLIPRASIELPWYSVHGWSGGATWATACLTLHAAAAAAWTLGWRTRWAGLACLVLTIGLHARAPWVLHRGDAVLRLALFWSLFLPMGARWSLDARTRPDAPIESDRVEGLAVWGWTLQLAQVYLWSVAYKLHPAWTHDASAVHEALSLDAYTTSLGRWVLALPPLTRALTWGTLAIEAAAPLLLFLRSARARLACVVLFFGFHLGLMATMRLGLFMPIMCIAWASMLPSSVFGSPRDHALPRAGRPTRAAAAALIALTIAYNAEELRRFRHTHELEATHIVLLPEPARVLTAAIGLNQRWSMFAPRPARQDAWIRVVDARTGEDLLGGLPPGERPHDRGVLPLRWRQLVSRITDRWDYEHAETLLAWTCRHNPGATTLTAEVTYEHTAPPGEESLLEQALFGRVECSELEGDPQN